jgi:glyoxylase-like metal-dependent hydrolase (beta-lactamase superfamily II)
MSTEQTRIHALELGPMENFIYLVEDVASQRCAVVDPAWDVPAITARAQALGLDITDILLTHSHHDHINGIEALLEHSPAQIHLLKPEYEFWNRSLEKPDLHHGGDRIMIGNSEINVLHTPGHTPGSACFQVGQQLITGDTLFVFGCGRCDLHGGDPEQMFVTLKNIRQRLDPATTIHPGHNYAEKETSSLQEQVDGNPFMHFDQRDQFVRYRMEVHDRTRDAPYGPVSHQQLRVANLLS